MQKSKIKMQNDNVKLKFLILIFQFERQLI